MTSARWDTDERGHGVGDAGALLPDVERLVEAMRSADWVAEQPEDHLLPHVRALCAAPDSQLALRAAEQEGDVFTVDLTWSGAEDDGFARRRAVWALLSRIAEPSCHVRERHDGSTWVFDVTTGVLDGDSEFAPHGHTLRVRVSPGER